MTEKYTSCNNIGLECVPYSLNSSSEMTTTAVDTAVGKQEKTNPYNVSQIFDSVAMQLVVNAINRPSL